MDQTDLSAHDSDGSVVNPGVLAQLGVVGGKEVLVEIQPGIFGTGQRGGRDDGDYPQEQTERSGHLGPGAWVSEHLERAGEEGVLRGEGRLGAVECQRVGSVAAAQQEGERDGLGVGVGELFVRGV